ncbi:MAG: winged helix-turn-helix domain-containing protein, partial [Nitrososphaerales archaeon]
MAIPDYQMIMLPLLKFLGDEKEHSKNDAVERISDDFKLSEKERRELVPSLTATLIRTRVSWSSTYLKKAGLLESPRRGFLKITQRGKDVLKENPLKLDYRFLNRFPEFVEFWNPGKHKMQGAPRDNDRDSFQEDTKHTPEEVLDNEFQRIQLNLSEEILESVKKCPPE